MNYVTSEIRTISPIAIFFCLRRYKDSSIEFASISQGVDLYNPYTASPEESSPEESYLA